VIPPARSTLTAVALLVVTATLFLVSCGSSDDNSNPATTQAASPGAPSPSIVLKQPDPVQPLDEDATRAEGNVIGISVRDAKYIGNKLLVPLGDVVTVRVTNNDQQPHNLRIAGFDGEYNTDDDIVTEPETIGGGQTGEVSFAPAVAGAYTFHCDFHPGSMGGQIIVQ